MNTLRRWLHKVTRERASIAPIPDPSPWARLFLRGAVTTSPHSGFDDWTWERGQ